MGTGSLFLAVVIGVICLGAFIAGVVIAIRERSVKLLLLFLVILGFGAAILIPLMKSAQPSVDEIVPAESTGKANTMVPPAETTVPRQVNGQSMNLLDAGASGLITYSITGNDLSTVNLTLTLTGKKSLEVIIPAGTIFSADAENTQNMVVRVEQRILLNRANPEITVSIPAACINMSKEVPSEENRFNLTLSFAGGDLLKLVKHADFQNQTFRVQQFAIWTITDNPARDEYTGISSGGFGSGPNDEEINAIRALFKKAGINANAYWALQ